MTKPFGGEHITDTVELVERPDPLSGTPEYTNALQRSESTRSISAMPWLPQLPDAWAQELHDRIEDRERSLIAYSRMELNYIDGTATYPDELAIVKTAGTGRYLLSAEHATRPIIASAKNKGRLVPGTEAGTGGLAAVLAEDYGTAVIMRGRQTTNVPSVIEHPLKDVLYEELPTADGFISVHAKSAGMFTRPSDQAEVHACLGLGLEPTEALRDFAHKIMETAKDELGLYIVLSNDQECYIQKPRSAEYKRLEDGFVKRSSMAGLKPRMTNNVSRRFLSEIDRPVPSLQIEMSPFLRLTSLDIHPKDKKTRVIGAALGYQLLQKIIELTPTAYRPESTAEVVE